MAESWYYARKGVRQGPVTFAEIRQLAAEGQLSPDDLIWKQGLTEWVKASTAKGLFPTQATNQPKIPTPPQVPPVVSTVPPSSYATPPSPPPPLISQPHIEQHAVPNPTMSAAASTARKAAQVSQASVQAAVGGLTNMFGKLGSKLSQATNTDANAPPQSDPTSLAPLRLPEGASADQVIAQASVSYLGGHPTLLVKARGTLVLLSDVLAFIGDNQQHDLQFAYRNVRDILEPKQGSFPAEMVEQASKARSAASLGQNAALFAGNWMGSQEGRLLKAVGGTAAAAAKEKAALGPPPKNRLTVLFLVEGTLHKVMFDIAASTKQQMEQVSEEFWMKAATVRPKFLKNPSKSTPGAAMPGDTRNPPKNKSQRSMPGEPTFRCKTSSGQSRELSSDELLSRLRTGELSDTDLIAVETWLPVGTIKAIFGMVGGGEQRTAGRNASETPSQQNFTSPESLPKSQGASKKSSVIPVAAAAVGGVVVGAVASSVYAAANAPRKGGHSSQRGHGVTALDTNHDGVADTFGVDSDHDGRIDAVGIDSNGDGRVDTVGMDTDHDGHVDTVGFDRDGDGRVEQFGKDTDHDGDVDVVGLDTDHDGDIDAVGVDRDNDGSIDTVGVDRDGDGDIDAVGYDVDEDGDIDAVGVDEDDDGDVDSWDVGDDSDEDDDSDDFDFA